ncbi:unnamed protein product, partial [Amoebophrya sp. A25]
STAEILEKLRDAGFDERQHITMWKTEAQRQEKETEKLQKKPRYVVPCSDFFVVAYDFTKTLRRG